MRASRIGRKVQKAEANQDRAARASALRRGVAIGFIPGLASDGVTVVRGRDAHAWPQVVIGGSWVSFEPTPQLPSGEISPPASSVPQDSDSPILRATEPSHRCRYRW